jgi:chromosomal replication initiation ATPase DnaA
MNDLKKTSSYLVDGRRQAKKLAESIGRKLDVEPSGILGSERSDTFALARRDLYLALWRLGYSIADVGRILGKHHTTVIHGLRALMGKEAYAAEMARRMR